MTTRRALLTTGGALLVASPASIVFGAQEPEVTAAEDLMREHGVIRRCLLLYGAVVPRLRATPASIDVAALRHTGELFRAFGEDYHEKQLEEAHIFPVIRKMKSVARYADILTTQHQRGREITRYLLAVTNGRKISAAHAQPLASALEGLVRMYEHHAAREAVMSVQGGRVVNCRPGIALTIIAAMTMIAGCAKSEAEREAEAR